MTGSARRGTVPTQKQVTKIIDFRTRVIGKSIQFELQHWQNCHSQSDVQSPFAV
jgi:hypothetical protein